MSQFISFEDFLEDLQKAKQVLVNGNLCNYALINHDTSLALTTNSVWDWNAIKMYKNVNGVTFWIKGNPAPVSSFSKVFQYKNVYIFYSSYLENKVSVISL